MFFDDDEMKVAEDLAWKMLDGWNHEYCPNLSEYAHFYYNGKVILDPWMNEKSQGLPWPDHESRESAVDPVKYYGMDTIENYITRLFLLRPDWAPDITDKIRANINEQGKLIHTTTIMPVEVYIAMPEQQADEEYGYRCLGNCLPDSYRVYFAMEHLPVDLCQVVEMGWRREVIIRRKDFNKVMKMLYPEGITHNYKYAIDRIYGNKISLIGFGD